MNKANVRNLEVIITRNCNLECEMCFRGDRENAYANHETLENLFKGINEIDNLVISGGEPFLDDKALNRIDKIIELIQKYNVHVGCVRMVTNGTRYSKRIEEVIIRLYSLAEAPVYNELCVSDDKYHDDELDKLGLKQAQLGNIEEFKEICSKNQITFKLKKLGAVYDYGRAKNLNIPKMKYSLEFTHLIVAGLYLGNIPYACVYDDGDVTFREYPYNEKEEYVLFNVNETDMYHGMAHYAEGIPEDEIKDDLAPKFFF